MARGKAAAQAANRRLVDALARIAELEHQQAEWVATHRTEVAQLHAELQQAQGTISRQIKDLADDRVAAERDRANAAIQEIRDAHLAQVTAGIARLDSIQTLKTHDVGEWADIAEAFGVQAGPLLEGLMLSRGSQPPRHLKRTSNGSARWKASIHDGIASGELKYVPDPKKTDRWREP